MNSLPTNNDKATDYLRRLEAIVVGLVVLLVLSGCAPKQIGQIEICHEHEPQQERFQITRSCGIWAIYEDNPHFWPKLSFGESAISISGEKQ